MAGPKFCTFQPSTVNSFNTCSFGQACKPVDNFKTLQRAQGPCAKTSSVLQAIGCYRADWPNVRLSAKNLSSKSIIRSCWLVYEKCRLYYYCRNVGVEILVAEGDSLESLSAKYDIPDSKLRQANGGMLLTFCCHCFSFVRLRASQHCVATCTCCH